MGRFHLAVADLLSLREKLLAGKVRLRDVVSDIDADDSEEFDEAAHMGRVVAMLDAAKAHQRNIVRGRRQLDQDETQTVAQRRRVEAKISQHAHALLEVISTLKLQPKQIELVAEGIKALAARATAARNTLKGIEERAGVAPQDLPKPRPLAQHDTAPAPQSSTTARGGRPKLVPSPAPHPAMSTAPSRSDADSLLALDRAHWVHPVAAWRLVLSSARRPRAWRGRTFALGATDAR